MPDTVIGALLPIVNSGSPPRGPTTHESNHLSRVAKEWPYRDNGTVGTPEQARAIRTRTCSWTWERIEEDARNAATVILTILSPIDNPPGQEQTGLHTRQKPNKRRAVEQCEGSSHGPPHGE